MTPRIFRFLFIAFFIFSSSCNGGGGAFDGGCDGSCPGELLNVDDVALLLARVDSLASKLDVSATVAISDRVGNILAVYQMQDALRDVRIDGQISAVGGLEGAVVPATLAAISKAGTAAFLSSQGNAFSTRTASQIIQENFNPGDVNQPGGPLFGVQFSQLICSDVTRLDSSTQGPRPLPLGLSADPGGIPLYKNGVLVGGIGVEVDGIYSFDRNVRDQDQSVEEVIAIASSSWFEPDEARLANRIFILGKALRFSDISYSRNSESGSVIADFNIEGLVPVLPFFDGNIRSGVAFGEVASGIASSVRAGIPSAVLVDPSGMNLYPAKEGSPLEGGIQLQAVEVDAILDSALSTANRARAAIRRPLDSSARVSIWVVDTLGSPLGFVRSQDAPVFGIDAALQKARTATFFSSRDAAEKLRAIAIDERGSGFPFEDYVSLAQSALGPEALTGTHAFADRSGGNLSRPFFPDGINGNPNGPFSMPFPGWGLSATGRSWSPFNTGLQLDLVLQRVLAPLSGVIPEQCTNARITGSRLANGMQIFPGSVPLYRNGALIGGIGVSGDGVDQDDLIAFFSASRAGLDFAGHLGVGDPELGFNAPKAIRADTLSVSSLSGVRLAVRLRYVNCPESPFLGTNDQNVCDDL